MENFAQMISAHTTYTRADFSSPAQVPVFLICLGDSMGASCQGLIDDDSKNK